MAFVDIQVQDVLAAMNLMDDPIEGPRLRKELHFGRSKHYRVMHQGSFYDSKPLVGIAHGIRTGEYLHSGDFSGGDSHLGWLRNRLGFQIDDQGWLHEISQLRVDRSHGRPAPYQYVVMLWAISRALPTEPQAVIFSDERRLMAFGDVRDELDEMLAPFAIAQTRPDPMMPWIALSSYPTIWESTANVSPMHERPGPHSRESVIRSDPAAQIGGLSPAFYSYLQWFGPAFTGPVLYFFEGLLGAEPNYSTLLDRLGLSDRELPIFADATPQVADAISAIEEIVNPRRQKQGRRFSAAENKAIEERAVAVVREWLENRGYATQDVGKSRSYDVHATKDGEVVKVEVKGTTTDGSQVVLTRNEVNLHRTEHPNTALCVVRYVDLDRGGSEPIATGGELLSRIPFEIDENDLQPIAYRFQTGF